MGYGFVNGAGYMGGWGMAFGGFMMIIWIGLLVALVFLLVRWISGTERGGFGPGTPANSRSEALTLLRDRYARGEIDTSDFEERAQKLQ